MLQATIFNIQKFCVHDGPGIRTSVFFKGCPLRCSWCHNPESQEYSRQLLYDAAKCTRCGECVSNCPRGALEQANNTIGYAASRCGLCGGCAETCLDGARTVAGEVYSIEGLMAEVEKDRAFYEHSGGGVTLSGGEALCQIDFVEELVRTCHRNGISVAVDTCGYIPFANIDRVLEYTDVFLYDLKLMDPAKHKVYTGQDNGIILANLQALCRRGARVNLRLPLVAGINDDDNNINAIIEFTKGLGIIAVNLLPYHDVGRVKYQKLNRKSSAVVMASPSQARLDRIKQVFADNGFCVRIGG